MNDNYVSPSRIGSGLAGRIDSPVTPVKPSHVQSTLSNLHGATCNLESIVEQLFKRLDTVIRHEPENPMKEAPPSPKPCYVGVANQIEEQAEKVHKLVSNLNNLLERIET